MSRAIRSVYWKWVGACTLGEVIGFGAIPAALGTVAFALTEGVAEGPRSLLLYLLSIVTGFGEGVVLALFQHRVLGRIHSRVERRRWVLATGTAASIAWAAGMLAPTLDGIFGLPAAVMIALWSVCGVVILLSIGWAQSRVLASAGVAGARAWIAWNVFGWILGLPWTFVLPAVVPGDAAPWMFGMAMAIGGVMMGATLGAVTGIAVKRWAQVG